MLCVHFVCGFSSQFYTLIRANFIFMLVFGFEFKFGFEYQAVYEPNLILIAFGVRGDVYLF